MSKSLPQLRLELAVAPSDDMRMDVLPVVGGATTCIFPLTSELISDHEEYRNALERLSELSSSVQIEFRSKVDLLFYQLFCEWREPLRLFYRGRGPGIGYYMSGQLVKKYDACMVVALELARSSPESGVKTWKRFRRLCNDELERIMRS